LDAKHTPKISTQHFNEKHSNIIECPHCDRDFNKQKDLDQHLDAKHTPKISTQHYNEKHNFNNIIECPHCDRDFNQQKDLDQHLDAKHTPKISTQPKIRNKYEERLREMKEDNFNERTKDMKECKSNKSYYGYYLCYCGRYWTSGHAYRDTGQQCTDRNCHKYIKPYQLDKKIERKNESRKPHLSNLCERAKLRLECTGCSPNKF